MPQDCIIIKKTIFIQLLKFGLGGGALTKYLLEIKNIDIKAVELDYEKAAGLEKKWPQLTGKIIY